MLARLQTGPAGLSWYAVLAAAVAVAWSTPGIAATDSVVECESLSGPLTGPSISPHALSLEVVDHIATETESPADDSRAAPEEISETTTPVLYLTPRVASILRDVFGADVDGLKQPADDNERAAEESPPVGHDNPTVAPIAERTENAEPVDGEEIAAPIDLIDEDEDIRRFQPEMYRTDI